MYLGHLCNIFSCSRLCGYCYVFLLQASEHRLFSWLQSELSAILRFGAEELFKEERNDEESKKRLLSMDIDEILERAEKVEEKKVEGEQANELLSAFKARYFHLFWLSF